MQENESPGAREAAYVVARRALLDPPALEPQRSSIRLTGAQAVYIHAGEANLAVAGTRPMPIRDRGQGSRLLALPVRRSA